MQYHAIQGNIMQYHAIPWNTMQYHAIPCNTMQYHAIRCNTMQYHAIPCNTMPYHAIPCNTMQYNAMPCYTMQYHSSLITADGAYHCPVGSIMAIFFIFKQPPVESYHLQKELCQAWPSLLKRRVLKDLWKGKSCWVQDSNSLRNVRLSNLGTQLVCRPDTFRHQG